jgi:glycosyltransferase involved in cell wall biosynthesis
VRIALDASYSVGRQLTGIGVYSSRLIASLAKAHPRDRILLCYRAKPFLAAPQPRFENVRRRLLAPSLPLFRADLFHALNQRVDYRPARRVVSTFHDLFVLTAEYSSPAFRARFAAQARDAAARSDLIIAVSEFTSRQIQGLLGVPESRIRVIPHGVVLPALSENTHREEIILFVGALQIRKNIERLVAAFERLPGRWKLVLAGAATGYGAPAIVEQIDRSSARDRIQMTGHISQEQLEALFRKARVFAFPSLDEGFGMPVLEAMAFGVPVVTSNRSALPEAAGDAALLVNPESVDEIEHALRRLMEDDTLRNQLAHCGRERAARFSWRETARQTYAAYSELY